MVDSNRVMAWAKISRRQLDHWVEKGFIEPLVLDGQRGGWSGTHYDWSMAEAAVVRKMGQLTAAGIPPVIAAKVARGDRKRIEMLLGALAGCVTSLRWELAPASEVADGGGVASEAEPCG